MMNAVAVTAHAITQRHAAAMQHLSYAFALKIALRLPDTCSTPDGQCSFSRDWADNIQAAKSGQHVAIYEMAGTGKRYRVTIEPEQ